MLAYLLGTLKSYFFLVLCVTLKHVVLMDIILAGNDSSAQNDWHGAWWHSSFTTQSGQSYIIMLLTGKIGGIVLELCVYTHLLAFGNSFGYLF